MTKMYLFHKKNKQIEELTGLTYYKTYNMFATKPNESYANGKRDFLIITVSSILYGSFDGNVIKSLKGFDELEYKDVQHWAFPHEWLRPLADILEIK